ncbi:MAG: FKBP-type peptidyl-prolyl cis-trans isomerase [Arachnia sp.]
MTYSPTALRRLVIGAAAASLISLTACGSAEPGEGTSGSPSPSPSSAAPSPSPSPTVSVSPSPDLSGVSVTGDETPKIEVKAPWGIASTQTKVLKEGGKQVVGEHATVNVDYVGIIGRTGKEFESTYGSTPAEFPLDYVVPGFKKAIAGQKVGSRVLVAMTSADGYPNGRGDILPGDTLIFVIDIHAASFDKAEGDVVPPVKDLPVVTMKDDKPEIAIPAGVKAPTELVAQDLIKGPGAKVEANSTVTVQYRSWTYGDGALFEDAWQAQEGPLANLIQGWKEGLVGKTAGSRVLLVVPPAKAYPDGRPSPSPTLAANQTLVYVIDILDVAAPAS